MKLTEFIQQIKDLFGYDVKVLDINYNNSDSRVWSVLISPSEKNLIVTFHINKEYFKHKCFDILGNNINQTGLSLENVLSEIERA